MLLRLFGLLCIIKTGSKRPAEEIEPADDRIASALRQALHPLNNHSDRGSTTPLLNKPILLNPSTFPISPRLLVTPPSLTLLRDTSSRPGTSDMRPARDPRSFSSPHGPDQPSRPSSRVGPSRGLTGRTRFSLRIKDLRGREERWSLFIRLAVLPDMSTEGVQVGTPKWVAWG